MTATPPPPPLQEPPLAAPPTTPYTGPLRPGGIWYIIGALLIVASVIIPGVMAMRMFGTFFGQFGDIVDLDPVSVEIASPGQEVFHVDHAGRHEISRLYEGLIGGRRIQVSPELPEAVSVSLTDLRTGRPVALRPTTDDAPAHNPDDESGEGESARDDAISTGEVSLWNFDAAEPGDFRLEVTGTPPPDEKRMVFRVRRAFDPAKMGKAFESAMYMPVAGLISTGCFLGGLAIVIVTAVKRSNFRRKQSQSAYR